MLYEVITRAHQKKIRDLDREREVGDYLRKIVRKEAFA